jgi:large subunit ribosomal protein L18e
MKKTKTKIRKQLERKINNELIETIISAKKNDKWKEVASFLSGPRKNRINLNIGEINKKAKEGEIIVIPGKVLSHGELNKKMKIVAFAFSERAKEKIEEAKSSAEKILNEIKKNPEAKGIRILTEE